MKRKIYFQPSKYKYRAGGMVAQIGLSTYFSEHLRMAASYISKLLSQFSESPVMTAFIIGFLPIFTQLRKCAVGDIIPSLIGIPLIDLPKT